MRATSIAAALVLAAASAGYSAGNVHVQIDAGRVMLQGDEDPNAIVVTAGGEEDAIVVIGLDGTTVNGLPELVVLGVESLRARTGEGADRVDIQQVRIRGTVQLRLGNGDDVVVAEQSQVRRLDVRTGRGFDVVAVGPQARVGRLLRIHTGRDPDRVRLESSSLSSIVVVTGPGDDALTIFDATVVRGTQVFTNAGEDDVFFGLADFVRDVDLNLGEDDDILHLDSVLFDGDADLDGGDDDDALLFDGPVEFDEDSRLDDFEFCC
jgi:hypothetical protein